MPLDGRQCRLQEISTASRIIGSTSVDTERELPSGEAFTRWRCLNVVEALARVHGGDPGHRLIRLSSLPDRFEALGVREFVDVVLVVELGTRIPRDSLILLQERQK